MQKAPQNQVVEPAPEPRSLPFRRRRRRGARYSFCASELLDSKRTNGGPRTRIGPARFASGVFPRVLAQLGPRARRARGARRRQRFLRALALWHAAAPTPNARAATGRARNWTAPRRTATATPDRVARARAAAEYSLLRFSLPASSAAHLRDGPRARWARRARCRTLRRSVHSARSSDRATDTLRRAVVTRSRRREAPAAETRRTETTAGRGLSNCDCRPLRVTRLPPPRQSRGGPAGAR
jgi:hypothetical protein